MDTIIQIIYAIILGLIVGVIGLFFIAYYNIGDPGLLSVSKEHSKSDEGLEASIEDMSHEFLTVLAISAYPDYTGYTGMSVWYILESEKSRLLGNKPQPVPITQQVVQQRYIPDKRGIRRKIYEWAYSFRLERYYTEHEILTAYANMLSIGGKYNLPDAAKMLFAKPLSKLDYVESTLMISLAIENNHLTARDVLRRMNYLMSILLDRDFIDQSDYEIYRREIAQLKDYVEYILSVQIRYGIRRDTGGVRYGALRYRNEIYAAADRYGIERALLLAIVQAESAGNPNAISHAGARGLGQVMLSTARSIRPDQTILRMDLYDVYTNLDLSADYISRIEQRVENNFPDVDYKTRIQYIAAAYNAGWSRVERVRGIPAIRETQIYVQRVWHFYNIFRNEENSGIYVSKSN